MGGRIGYLKKAPGIYGKIRTYINNRRKLSGLLRDFLSAKILYISVLHNPVPPYLTIFNKK